MLWSVALSLGSGGCCQNNLAAEVALAVLAGHHWLFEDRVRETPALELSHAPLRMAALSRLAIAPLSSPCVRRGAWYCVALPMAKDWLWVRDALPALLKWGREKVKV